MAYKLTLSASTQNVAVKDGHALYFTKLLRDLADMIEFGKVDMNYNKYRSILDVNGQNCGTFRIESWPDA